MSIGEWIGFGAEGLACLKGACWIRSSDLSGRDGTACWIAPLSWVHTLILVTFAALLLPAGVGRVLVPVYLVLVGLQIWLVRVAWRRGAAQLACDREPIS